MVTSIGTPGDAWSQFWDDWVFSGITVCTSRVGEGDGDLGVLDARGFVGEMVGVREIASVSLASTVWYAWVTFSVGVVVARAGKLQALKINAQIPQTSK